ncbi:hypothetical protein ACJX0J_023153, partial [Zea mays]
MDCSGASRDTICLYQDTFRVLMLHFFFQTWQSFKTAVFSKPHLVPLGHYFAKKSMLLVLHTIRIDYICFSLVYVHKQVITKLHFFAYFLLLFLLKQKNNNIVLL